jgi:hypothetical protein
VNAMVFARRSVRSIVFALVGLVAGALVETAWAQPAPLYSNGPLVSVPGGGAGGVDANRLQSALGMTSLGYNAKLNGSSIRGVADDFTVPASGWNLTRITVFAYQTDSGMASTLTDLRLLIFNGPPQLPSSAVVYGNPGANVLASTGFAQVFRDSQLNPGLTRRPIMAATANVNIFLPGGTYWLVWAMAGKLVDGPWVPPITINGQTTTGNGLQLCTCSGWGPALDGGSNTQQGFPFVIDGSVAGSGGGGGGATAASLSVGVNAPTLRAGNRLAISATLAGSGPTRYDAYVLIDVAGGGVVSVTPGGVVPGVVPYARNLTAVPLSGTLLDMGLPPVPLGTYGVRGYLTLTGQPAPATPVSHAGFTVVQ